MANVNELLLRIAGDGSGAVGAIDDVGSKLSGFLPPQAAIAAAAAILLSVLIMRHSSVVHCGPPAFSLIQPVVAVGSLELHCANTPALIYVNARYYMLICECS